MTSEQDLLGPAKIFSIGALWKGRTEPDIAPDARSNVVKTYRIKTGLWRHGSKAGLTGNRFDQRKTVM
jgi:hypothetical protein